MIEVEYEGCVYRYCPPSGRNRGSWIGISGSRKSNNMFSGPYCSIPLAHWQTLQKIAIEQGVCVSTFRAPEKKKKSGTPRKAKKNNGPSISIF